MLVHKFHSVVDTLANNLGPYVVRVTFRWEQFSFFSLPDCWIQSWIALIQTHDKPPHPNRIYFKFSMSTLSV